jgi:hypothetical protein
MLLDPYVVSMLVGTMVVEERMAELSCPLIETLWLAFVQ